jgi:hypothetical protein
VADTIEIDLLSGDAAAPLSVATGSKYKIVIKRPVLKLSRLYHDDRPVEQAPFTVRLANGQKVQGTLDASGKAAVILPAAPQEVQFGPDGRDWKRVDQTKNPELQELTAGDVDAFVNARFETSPDGGSTGSDSGSGDSGDDSGPP